ncbi:MAG: NACHT and WD repeat domain-containing protein, partial [Gammaproteobacteria bacterium]
MSAVIAESLAKLAEVEKPINPFPGLRPFEFHENHLFFGRDGQSEALIDKLGKTRFLAVVGTSGSGKSSLVRAGLLPALYGGMMANARSNWRAAIMRPGNDPIGNLARALNSPDALGAEDKESLLQTAILEATLRRGNLGLVEAVHQAHLAPHENLLVLVDQFEELFRVDVSSLAVFTPSPLQGESQGQGMALLGAPRTQGGDGAASGRELSAENDKAAFVKLLLAAKQQQDLPIYVVLTMRSDYLGDCAQFWDLPEAINQSQYLIPRMTREQRRAAITGPVAVGGAEITPRLVNRLLNDVGDNPDQLPILQHALMRTWDEWKQKRPEHRERHEGESIDSCCYEAIGGMSEALSIHADEAYYELPDDRHRRVAEKLFKCLTEKGPDNREVRRPTMLEEICAVAEATEAEVITVIETFRKPGRSFLMPLAGVELNAQSLIDISHESLIRNWKKLREWVEQEAQDARLYKRLAEDAVDYSKGTSGLWRDPALQLVLDWKGRERPNRHWAERYHARFEETMGFLEMSRKGREKSRRQVVLYILLGLISVLSLWISVYAARGWIAAQKAQQKAAEQQALAETQKLAAQSDLAFKTSGRYLEPSALLAVESMRRVHVLEGDRALRQALSLLPIVRVTHEATVGAVAFSHDGRYLATGSNDNTARVVDVTTGKELIRVAHEATVGAVAFSPDGRYLATASEDNTARVVDVTTGKELSRVTHEGAVVALAFSPDGRYLATGSGDNTARVVESMTGKELI